MEEAGIPERFTSRGPLLTHTVLIGLMKETGPFEESTLTREEVLDPYDLLWVQPLNQGPGSNLHVNLLTALVSVQGTQ